MDKLQKSHSSIDIDKAKTIFEELFNKQIVDGQSSNEEEMKKLAESSDDDYLHSSWADPKQLQRSLRGQDSSIRAPGLR